MPVAVVSFQHFEYDVHKGDEPPDDPPLVVARPDLFTEPAKPRKAAKKEQ
jgi:hypothetical protein